MNLCVNENKNDYIHVHVYGNHFQRSSSLRPPRQSKPNCMWKLLGKGEKVYMNGPGHRTKMAAMPIYGKNLQISNSPMIMTLGLEHYVLSLRNLQMMTLS